MFKVLDIHKEFNWKVLEVYKECNRFIARISTFVDLYWPRFDLL